MFRIAALLRSSVLLFVLIHSWSPARAAGILTAQERAMLPYFAEVMRASGYGLRSSEEAAFLVRDEDRDVVCVRWPSSAKQKEQNYRGPVPADTIAIVHSHPLALRRPSANDRAEARRVGLPFYVVSRDSLWVAEPDGTLRELFRERNWWRRSDAEALSAGCVSTTEFVVDAARRGVPVEWRSARADQ